MAKLLRGYTRDTSSAKARRARRYRTPSGKSISRRQYENLRYSKSGVTWSQVQSIKSGKSRALKRSQGEDTTLTYKRWLNAAEKETGLSARQLNAPDSEFNRLLGKAIDDEFAYNATGSFHDFLVYLGYRTDNEDFDSIGYLGG